jgi:hypothetical protein
MEKKNEQKQFLIHWLNSIEDNPQELLKEVFKREYLNQTNKAGIENNSLNVQHANVPW